MRQDLTTDEVSRWIAAPADQLYDVVADVTRTPELSPDIVSCRWLEPARGPAVGARFHAINRAQRGPNWPNDPVVLVADRGSEFTFERTEPFAGTVRWRYRFQAEDDGGTTVTESYDVTKPITIVGWFIIGTLYGRKDRRSDLRAGMTATLERLAEIVGQDLVR